MTRVLPRRRHDAPAHFSEFQVVPNSAPAASSVPAVQQALPQAALDEPLGSASHDNGKNDDSKGASKGKNANSSAAESSGNGPGMKGSERRRRQGGERSEGR